MTLQPECSVSHCTAARTLLLLLLLSVINLEKGWDITTNQTIAIITIIVVVVVVV